MRVLDLFSGIGGFSIGLEDAGMTTAAFCEIAPWCRRVLAKHWPDVPIHENIKTLKGDSYGPIDLICGGFPCQPYSASGKRGGIEDDRYLWPEMLRVTDESKASWFIGENVVGLVSMGVGYGDAEVESRRLIRTLDEDFYEVVFTQAQRMLLDRICEDLERIGFEVQPIIVPACGVNAPHIRGRIWIIAYSSRNWSGKRLDRDSAQGAVPSLQPQPCRGAATSADAHDFGREGRGERPLPRLSNLPQQSARGLTRIGKRWDLPASRVCRGHDGVPDRLDRLRALGNAVVPHIPYIFGYYIQAVERLLLTGGGVINYNSNCSTDFSDSLERF